MIVEDLMKVEEPEPNPNRLYETNPAANMKPVVDTHAVAGALFDLNSQAARLAVLIDGMEEGELTPEAEELMAEIMQEGPEQIEAAVVVVRDLEAKRAANLFEAKRYTERAQSVVSQIDFLKSHLSAALDVAFGGKVKTKTVTVYNQDSNTESVELREGVSLDEMVQSYPHLVKVTLSLDKKAIKEESALGDSPLDTFVEVKHNHSRSVRIR